MKITLRFLLLVFGLMVLINAQGITNTLGGNTADDKFIIENSDSEAGLVVTGEGKVGIGTTNPTAPLHINTSGVGVLKMNALNPQVDFMNDGLYHTYLQAHTNNFYITNRLANGSIFLGTNNTTRMTIDEDGDVGIATTAPGADLDVNGDVILGTNGSRFLEIQEITGTTGTSNYMSYSDKLPSGWTGAKTRVLSLEIQFNSSTGAWYSMGYTYTPGGKEIAISLIHFNRDVTIFYPNADYFHGRTWRAMIMRMP